MNKPGLPQGTRDFGAETVHKRRFILDCIRRVFELSGFEPLETPAMENLDTLLGKYGDEGDKLLFKILNNGLDHPSKIESARAGFESVLEGKNNKSITERALRYDLTIPFARYVAMHHHELAFPFKRYQIQPVWRADRPQKGRYREFFQCDADVVGSRSLLNEAELTRIYLEVFKQLRIPVDIRLNNRKILAGLADACGGPDLLVAITTSMDKLDKIGMDKVKAELAEKNLSAAQIAIVQEYLDIQGTNEEKLSKLEKRFPQQAQPASDNGNSLHAGIREIRELLQFFPGQENISLDLSLARGLSYYTGVIFEVRAAGVSIGSIGGGGRYDDLTGLFGLPNIPGVGISFGVDRIYDVMEELKLFPAAITRTTEILFFNLGEEPAKICFHLAEQLRSTGIRCELYPEQARFDKQFKYAEKKKIPHIVVIGPEELGSGKAKIKDLASGVQEECPFGDLTAYAARLNRDNRPG